MKKRWLTKHVLQMIGIVAAVALIVSGCGGQESGSGNNQSTGNQSSQTPSSTPPASEPKPAEPEKVFVMEVNAPTPQTHHLGRNLFDPWKELVEEETEGRVKVNLHYGGALGTSTTSWQDINNRVYDVGLVFPTYFYDTELFPATIGNLSFAFSDMEGANNILDKWYESYVMDAYKDSILIATSASDPYIMFSTKPIRTVEDLKGKSVRVQGKAETSLVTGWGASPVTIDLSEMYQSLQKGVVDVVIYSAVGGVGQKLHEVAPYITALGVSTTPLTASMNREFYDSLPDDLKKKFDEVLIPKFEEMFTNSYISEFDKAYAEYEKQVAGRGELIRVNEEVAKGFKGPGKEQWDGWVSDANNKGYNGEQMMDDFKKMLEEEGQPLPF